MPFDFSCDNYCIMTEDKKDTTTKQKRASAKVIAQIGKLYLQGFSQIEIVKELDVSKTFVSNVLKRLKKSGTVPSNRWDLAKQLIWKEID